MTTGSDDDWPDPGTDDEYEPPLAAMSVGVLLGASLIIELGWPGAISQTALGLLVLLTLLATLR